MSRLVDAVIFDFGGVLVDWDARHLFRDFFDDPGELDVFVREVWGPENDRCDRGRPFGEMIAELVEAHPHHEAAIRASGPDARWPEMIAGPVPGMVELLDDLGVAGVRRCSLSNFSAETFPMVRDRFECFGRLDDIFISGAEGLAKPDRAAFDEVARRNDLDPSRTVFVDDSPGHTAAADSYGYLTVTFRDAGDLRRRLTDWGALG